MSTTIQIQYAKKLQVRVTHFPKSSASEAFLTYDFQVTDNEGNKQIIQLFALKPIELDGITLDEHAAFEISRFEGIKGEGK